MIILLIRWIASMLTSFRIRLDGMGLCPGLTSRRQLFNGLRLLFKNTAFYFFPEIYDSEHED